MKNKGFTLIELLGVITIISLILLIVFPNIIGTIKNSSGETDDVTIKMIYNASDLYISNHPNDFLKLDGNKYIITLNDLIDDKLLSSPIKLSDSDVTNLKCVQVTYMGKFEYELMNTGECIELINQLCTLTDNDGNGIISMGDEVTCDTEKFNVISSASEKVIMLSSKNIEVSLDNPHQSDEAGTIAFSSSNYWDSTYNNTYGRYIYNLNSNLYNYVESYKKYLKSIGVSVIDARLVKFEELMSLGCDYSSYSCSSNSFVYSTSYFSGTSSPENDSSIWTVSSNGEFNYEANNYQISNKYGIRPVIEIPISNISLN